MENNKEQVSSSTWTCNICSEGFPSSSEFISHGERIHTENQYSTCVMCDSVVVSEKQLNGNANNCNSEQTSSSVSDQGFRTIEETVVMDICKTTTLSTVTSHREGFQGMPQDDSVGRGNESKGKLTICSTCYEMLPVLRSPEKQQEKSQETSQVQSLLSPVGNIENTQVESDKTETDEHSDREEAAADVSELEKHSADPLIEQTDKVSESDKTFLNKGNFPFRSDECKYECDQCYKTFTEKKKIREHLRTHNEVKLFQCGLCDKAFRQKSHLVKHLRIHTGEKPFKCDQCDKAFTQKPHLTYHLRTHTGEKPYKRDQCNKAFTEKGSLTKHIRIHSGEKPFKCDQCGKSFAVKGALNRHLRMHTGEKPFQCDQCQKTFARKYTLTLHLRTHSGEKPYQCDQCDKAFAIKGTLTGHLRTHNGEKPFQCVHCSKTFAQKHNLTYHLRTHVN